MVGFWEEGVSKPDSVAAGTSPAANGHSSGPAVAGEIFATVPEGTDREERPGSRAKPERKPPYLILLQMGFAAPTALTAGG
jgi:hypothetical protein